MGKIFNLKIVAPEEDFFEGNVVNLNCETTDGRRGIMANHSSMIAALTPTTTIFQDEIGNKYKVKTSQGVIKVKKNHVIILCDYASWDNASIDK